MRIASLTVALVAVPLLAPQPASACTKGSLGAPLGERMVFFTGTATVDTLRAGPGSVRYGAGGGHFAAGVEREIYGQLVAVGALGGRAVEGWAEGVEEVVVVPWDYDPACRPLPWGRSARWVQPGTEGFYIAELRAPEHWVDGKPTVDLHNPGNLPYTTNEPIRGMMPGTPVDSMLTHAQLFDLYRALPSASEIDGAGAAALGPLRDWIERNAELARRPPAHWLVGGVVSVADREELSRLDHPVHGTWRFDIRLPDGSARIVYGRTDPRSTDRWVPSRERFEWTPEQLLPPPAEGVTLMITFAHALDALPDTVQPMNLTRGRIYTVSGMDPLAAEDRSWAGSLDYVFLSAAIGRHPVVHQVFLAETERYRALYRAGSPDPMPAVFTRDPSGVLRVRRSYLLPGGEEVLVEGEQLSREVLTTPG